MGMLIHAGVFGAFSGFTISRPLVTRDKTPKINDMTSIADLKLLFLPQNLTLKCVVGPFQGSLCQQGGRCGDAGGGPVLDGKEDVAFCAGWNRR